MLLFDVESVILSLRKERIYYLILLIRKERFLLLLNTSFLANFIALFYQESLILFSLNSYLISFKKELSSLAFIIVVC